MKFKSDRKTALVFTGGGARGIFQAGVLRAWINLCLQYDVMYGTSIGTLNGGMLHQGMSADELEDFWLTISNKKVRTFAPWLTLTSKGCLYNTAPLRALIAENADFEKVRANPIPFIVNTTNLDTWEPEPFLVSSVTDNNKLLDVVMASTAMPVIFPPIKIGDSMYGDGGLSNNYCVGQAVADGATRLIVVTPELKEPRKTKSIYDTIQVVAKLPTSAELNSELSCARHWRPDLEITVIRPEKIIEHGKLLNFNMSLAEKRYWLDEGERIGMKALSRLI